MAIESGFFSDAGLSSALTTKSFSQRDDDTSDPLDAVVYFGLPNGSKKVEADSDPGVDQITISIATNIASWVASTAYVLNDLMQPPTPNGYKYKCTVAGTSGASEPTYTTTIGSTFTDGTATWTCLDEIHQTTEIKLATSQANLDTATGGASLDIGTTINGGNPVAVWIRADQGVHPVGTSSDIKLSTVDLAESVI